MKTWIKRFCAGALAIGICLGLTSCKHLDNLRATRAVWMEKEETLGYNGSAYHRLPEGTQIPILRNSTNGCVTDADVPILLANMFGDRIYISGDKNMISVSENGWWGGPEHHYCIDVLYDRMAAAIKDPNPPCYLMNYELYPQNDEEYDAMTRGEFQTDRYELLSAEAVRALEETLKQPALIGEFNYDSYVGTIYRSDPDGLTRSESGNDILCLSFQNRCVYAVQSSEGDLHLIADQYLPLLVKAPVSAEDFKARQNEALYEYGY